jgi:hypothetical protein
MPERLLLPASTGLRDEIGVGWMRGFCHRESLAREVVTKEAPVPSSHLGIAGVADRNADPRYC